MNKTLRILRYLVKISPSERRKILYIVYLNFKVSATIKYLPLNKYFYKYFSNYSEHLPDLYSFKRDLKLLKKVIKSLNKGQTCLKESIIVHLYFKRIGVEVPIFLGVKTAGKFQAHAWYDVRNANGFNQILTHECS